jgi:hypothetical protein
VRIGRRPLFFLVVAVVCVALLPPTPPEFRWVNVSAAATAMFWGILLAIEEVVARRQGALPPGVLRPPREMLGEEDPRTGKRDALPGGEGGRAGGFPG